MTILPDRPPADPWELVRDWLPDNDDPVRPTITVATAADGIADARTMLLSAFDEEGFLIHTDARSRKVAQLAANPTIALVILLPEDAHQLVVQGAAEAASAEETGWGFRHRSAYLQQLAWQGTDEFATLPLTDRRQAWAGFAADHRDGFGQPPTWTGYRVRPARLTFWQGDQDTASRRLEYSRAGDGWEVTVLAG